jgi:hypothetical protein
MSDPKIKKAPVIKDPSQFTIKETYGTKPIQPNDPFILSLIKRALDKLESGEK